MARRSLGPRRFPAGPALVLGAGLLAGAVSSAIQGPSAAAFLLPFLFSAAIAGAVLLLRSLVWQARALQGSSLLAKQPYAEAYTTFEGGCLGLLAAMGFEVQAVQALPQGGIRVQAENLQPLLRGRYIIHCVEAQQPLDALLVGELHAEVTQARAHKGFYVTNASFTLAAQEFAAGGNVELIDGPRLDALLRQYSAAPPESLKGAP